MTQENRVIKHLLKRLQNTVNEVWALYYTNLDIGIIQDLLC